MYSGNAHTMDRLPPLGMDLTIPSHQTVPVPEQFKEEALKLRDAGQSFYSTTDEAFKKWLHETDEHIIATKSNEAQRAGWFGGKKTGKQPVDKKAYRKARNKHKKAQRSR